MASNSSGCRQNYSEESEAGINKQINLELNTSYLYTSLAFHFDRDDIASQGFYSFFKKMSDKKQKNTHTFLAYQNIRGGRIVLQDVKHPAVEWNSPVDALLDALEAEKKMADSYYALKSIAEKNKDEDLGHKLDDFVEEEVDLIKMYGNLLTELKRCGPGLGQYSFEKLTMKKLAEEI